jgi:valyl-tRNA synthetase
MQEQLPENELSKTYTPEGIEDKWYQTWMEQKSFKPVTSRNGKQFVILMPPPNVTGRLHMGHALDHTCQDIIIRHKRMQGYETLWIPGCDHAGIATQAKVEEKIFKEEGKTKNDLGREKFLEKVWDWKNTYGDEIVNQIKKLGDSCDWDYFTFTMDEVPNQSVKKVFVDLYNEGLIYQADYIINWDPTLQSAISDAEVDHKEVKGNLYHINYQIKDTNKFLEIATTRPETMFGDTAVAVNPNDDRFEKYIGKTVIIPICNREIPIIADEHVDMEFGTGCLKVTPGHDFNDFEIGKRHNLPIINILNKDGTLNENCPEEFRNLKTKIARKEVAKKLTELGALIKKEEHTQQVGHSQRSDDVVEPLVSKQWFLNTQKMAEISVEQVENGNMTFYPKGWENTYFAYQKNPRPWCISRQLWWGHQIPVYYCAECGHSWASEHEPHECPTCKSSHFKQDDDVLDTWFSSGLFPLSTLGWPNPEAMKEKGFDRFYPSTTLVTGFDIIFFWVARMMMMCEKATGKIPFRDVYIHAIVRDKNGQKMSKSLGNVIDPLDVMKEYGCDALRFSLAANSGYNRNINLDPAMIEGYRNFINKLWNAYRFIQPNLNASSPVLPNTDSLHHHEKWILTELNLIIKSVNESFDEYRFDDACSAIYSFVYDKFCSWFIELSKTLLNSNNENLKAQRATVLKFCFKEILKIVHPIIPFFSEELWSHLKDETEPLLISSEYPSYNSKLNFTEDKNNMEYFMEVVTAIRNLRASVNLKPKDDIKVKLFTDNGAIAKYFYQARGAFKDLARVIAGEIKNKNVEKPKKSIMQATTHTEIFVPLEGLIDMSEQVGRIKKDMAKTQDEYNKLQQKLSNPKFADNAPKEVVAEVKEKAQAFQEKLKSLEENLANFQ